MHTIKGLPVFEAVMGEDCGMLRISLVDFPAVEKDFLHFADKQQLKYSIVDDEKHIIFGCLMRANFPIYRIDQHLGEYWIVYTPDTLRKMAEKYLVENRQNMIDLDHDGKDVSGVQMVQMFIKDTAKGIAPAGFDDVEDGSLFGEFHVHDGNIWNAIKDGTYKGFSLEGLFEIAPTQKIISEEKINSELVEWLDSFTANFSIQDIEMAKSIKEKMAALLAKFGAVTTDKGTLKWAGDGELEVGMDVTTIDEATGEAVPAASGDYNLEDGTIVKVEDGKVAEIVDAAVEEAPAEPEQPAVEEAEGEAPEDAAPAEPEQPADDKEAKIAELEAKVADLEAKVAELESKLEQLLAMFNSHQPAKPAHEQFVQDTTIKSTGNAKLDAFARRMRE